MCSILHSRKLTFNFPLVSSSQSQHQVQGRFLLDIVVRQSSAVLQLLSSKDQSLLLWWDSLLILNLGLDILDGVIGLHIQRDRLSGQGLDEDLHGTTSQSEHQVQGRLLLDVVIGQRPSILQLLSRENQPLLLRWDALLVLDLGLDILDRVIGLHVQSDGLSGQRFHENLHRTTSQSQHQVQSRLLLDVIIGQSPAILQLFSRKDQSLLLRRDTFLVLDLGLDVLDRIIGLHIQRNGLTRQGLDEYLHGHD